MDVILDKWMKDRVLHKENDKIEENFTDDEESGDDEEAGGYCLIHFFLFIVPLHLIQIFQHEPQSEKNKTEEDKEEQEQERLAKHFAKRARRNRILDEYEGDSQFSRSRLIDEDESTQQDLKTRPLSCRRLPGISASR